MYICKYNIPGLSDHLSAVVAGDEIARGDHDLVHDVGDLVRASVLIKQKFIQIVKS